MTRRYRIFGLCSALIVLAAIVILSPSIAAEADDGLIDSPMILVGYVSDEKYVALPGVLLEFQHDGRSVEARSRATGAVYAAVEPGEWRVTLQHPGFGAKSVVMKVDAAKPHHFRLLSDTLLGYAWPNWIKAGERAEFRVHSTEVYKLELWRYGWKKELVRSIGWFDEVVYTDAGAMTGAPFKTIDAAHWAFAGTGLKQGDLFGLKSLHMRCPGGASGDEADKLSPSSPKNIHRIAQGTNRDEGGADMIYFDTPSGGAVFSAGSISYVACLPIDEQISKITKNVIERLLKTEKK